jgi:hypothetical protein
MEVKGISNAFHGQPMFTGVHLCTFASCRRPPPRSAVNIALPHNEKHSELGAALTWIKPDQGSGRCVAVRLFETEQNPIRRFARNAAA